MKDAKGHGSDSRTTFGKRTQIPYPAHQSGIAKLGGLAKTFLKSESGGGQIHGGAAHYLGTEFATKMHDPEVTARLAPELHEQMREGGIPHLGTLVHLAHFLGTLAAMAVVGTLVHWIIL